MTRYGVPKYQARHSGKSGFVSTTPVSTPKPFPFSFIEDVATQTYPEYRKYIPSDYQKYSDSYYDLRSKPYAEWYDKWGKKHIKSYMDYYTDAYQKVQRAKKELNALKTKNPALSKRNGWIYSYKSPKLQSTRERRCTCRNVSKYDKNKYQPRRRYRSWKPRSKYKSKRFYTRYY